jgi:spermidine synthase
MSQLHLSGAQTRRERAPALPPSLALAMLLVFAATLFASAMLLFLVQPMTGKMILPMLGGSPALWNTCMVFFQAMLLAGYAYAHASTRWLGVRRQAALHLLVLAVPFVVLPIAVNKALAPGGESNPVFGVLYLLLVSVGLPFFVVSASAPLLQKWFAGTAHPAARDPYFLYAASNLGSMLALGAYLLIVEPTFKLAQQSWLWMLGYGLLAALTAGCALLIWRSPPAPALDAAGASGSPPAAVMQKPSQRQARPRERPTDRPTDGPDGMQVTALRRLHWVALAFVPSSLMLGATMFITTDIAAIPLLWVLPLGLYLLSFILVFARLPQAVHKAMILALPLMILMLVFMMLSGVRPREWAYILSHLATLFVVAMVCHGELARRRPSASNLTEFYLWMSVGGVLGGMFNALLAPVLFNDIVEYQLAMVLACFLMPRLSPESLSQQVSWLDPALAALLALAAFTVFFGAMFNIQSQIDQAADFKTPDGGFIARLDGQRVHQLWGQGIVAGFVLLVPLPYFIRNAQWRSRAFDVVLPAALGLLSASMLWGLKATDWAYRPLLGWLFQVTDGRVDISSRLVDLVLMYGLPLVLCYVFVKRPVRFGLGVAAVLVLSGLPGMLRGDRLHEERSYFGILTVKKQTSNGHEYHTLIHGTTLHGLQCVDDKTLRQEPLSYYHRNGPVGTLFAAYPELWRNYAVIGLGTGSLAAYGDKDHKVTFYEIDRHVRGIAQNPEWFTYLTDYKERRGEEARIVMGDARLQLEKDQSEEKYGLIVVDAFSSDAIPVHLMTREAMQVFFDKLTEKGIIAFHISNRWLDLEPVLGNLVKDMKLAAVVKNGKGGDGGDRYSATWVAVARKDGYLHQLTLPAATNPCLLLGGTPCPSVSNPAALIGGILNEWTWREVKQDPEVGVWTDDYSNLVKVYKWKD